MKLRVKRLLKRGLFLLGLEERHVAFPIFRKKLYSQNGEDGVLEFVLQKLPSMPKFVVDIGANDGVTVSNSRMLIEQYGFKGVLIEPYKPVYEQLYALYASHPDVRTVDKAVAAQSRMDAINWHGHVDGLAMQHEEVNSVLEASQTPSDIGVLSIDIDGRDNEVLEAIDWSRFKPWIVIAEIDSSSHHKLQEQIELMGRFDYYPFLHIGNVFYVKKRHAGELFFNWKIPLKGRFGFFLKHK